MSEPKGPFRLVTVNTAPERAKKLIGRVVEDMKGEYTIEHIANCDSKMSSFLKSTQNTTLTFSAIDDVRPTVERLKPDVLVRWGMLFDSLPAAPSSNRFFRTVLCINVDPRRKCRDPGYSERNCAGHQNTCNSSRTSSRKRPRRHRRIFEGANPQIARLRAARGANRYPRTICGHSFCRIHCE